MRLARPSLLAVHAFLAEQRFFAVLLPSVAAVPRDGSLQAAQPHAGARLLRRGDARDVRWSGCILGAASLHAMRRVLERAVGPLVAHGAALLAVGLCGLGMYLGRVVRLNSWDLALRPRSVLTHAASAVQSREGLLLTLLFGGFFFVCYATMGEGGLRGRTSQAP
jgi:hypothetical protein